MANVFLRFITDGDKEWFDVELINTVRKELGEEASEIMKEPKYFVDFMRDAPEPTGEEVEDTDMELPKIYEPIESFKALEERLKYFLEQYNDIIRGSDMDLVRKRLLHKIIMPFFFLINGFFYTCHV